jgi:hypothetical protein
MLLIAAGGVAGLEWRGCWDQHPDLGREAHRMAKFYCQKTF